jgi:AraC-like DNA-binding protein
MTTRGTVPSALTQFSTSDVPDARRIELWEGHNAKALIGLRCRTLGEDPLAATEVNLQLDRIRLARVTGTSHVVERSAEVINSAPAAAVALYFTLVGEAFFYSDDGVRILRPGQLLVCDADRPFMRGFSQGLQELAVTVPDALFADIVGRPAPRTPLVIDFRATGNAHAHALATLVGRALHPSAPIVIGEQGILDLIAAAAGGRASMESAHFTAAKILIDRHLSDPGLSAARVAAGVGVSDRQLSRVFAQQELTVPQYISKRRLELAQKMLLDPAHTGQLISDIAQRCGFTSATHFARKFKELFGVRPADVRGQARALTE